MRISDWSSDVCSSDLPVEGSAQFDELTKHETLKLGIDGHEPIALEDRLGVAAKCRIAARFGILSGDDQDQIGTLDLVSADRWRQIGRASCRERVCKYV